LNVIVGERLYGIGSWAMAHRRRVVAIWLVSRMPEDFAQDPDARRAVLTGVRQSGRVVAAAATIMAAVFAGFILTGDPIVKSIAFALTVGVLVDAYVVRLTLVPALMTLLGKRARWLPSRGSRLG
jgi:RND superfamily putative drug exporter